MPRETTVPDQAARPSPSQPTSAGEPAGRDLHTLAWVGSTYVTQGLPYMLINFLFAAWLTDIGVKETWIGYLNYFVLAWSFKFLWAPAVDTWSTKRRWLLVVQGMLVVAFAVLTALVASGPRNALEAQHHPVLAAAIAVLGVSAVLAATHDIAIDGYYMEAIRDPQQQAAYTGLRSMAFQVAKLLVRSLLLAVAGWAGWHWGFGIGAAVLGLLWLLHLATLPRVESPARRGPPPMVALQGFGRAFATFLRQPGIALVLGLLLTYKLGDQLMFALNTTFFLREVGVTKAQFAWIGGVLGSAALTAGSMLAAWAIRRYGWKRAVWPLTLGMNLNIFLYVWLAWSVAEARSNPLAQKPGLVAAALTFAVEQFAGGLGASALIVFALRTCSIEFKAAHYAIATALASLGGALLGGMAGNIVERWGYTQLFLLSFAVSVPAMLLLPFAVRLPQLQDPPAHPD